MLASCPASMVNQKHTDLGIPNRFKLTASRFRQTLAKLKNEIWQSAKFPAEGAAPTPIIDLNKEIKTVDEKCEVYIHMVYAEINRIDELIAESGTRVGL
jgi:hypothetical protein